MEIIPDLSDEEIDKQLLFLDRAHKMSCSDPTDPTRTTSYSISAQIIRQLQRKIAGT